MHENTYPFNQTDKIQEAVTQNVVQPENTVHPDQSIVISPEVIPVLLPKPVYNFDGKTVLAVDDVAFNLDLITLFFRKTGAKILYATNGQEALEACMANPQIDIVLMDIQMPVMNGLDATRAIRKLNPGIPVIAITAFVHSEDKQRCFDAGCNDFLSKPCSRADMLLTVNNYFQESLTGHAG